VRGYITSAVLTIARVFPGTAEQLRRLITKLMLT
jgi:hypothetical protein